jgi:outer membrane protein assembly factor BamA
VYKVIPDVLKLRFVVPLLILVFSEILIYGQSMPYIRSIEVNSDNVFPIIDQSPEFIYKATNKFHSVTKMKVIQRELLFHAGDFLDLELIEESERILRKMDLFETVSIKVDTIAEDSVDILVSTIDQWSIIPALVIESGGGLVGIGGSIEEFNFLGMGKGLYFEGYHENDVGISWTIEYTDPQVFGTRLEAYSLVTWGPIAQGIFLGIERPFFSSDTKWSYGIDYKYLDEYIRLFDSGKEISRIDYHKNGIYLEGAYSFGKRYRKKRLKLMYRYVEKYYSPVEDQTFTPLPDDEVVSATSIGFSNEKLAFTKDTHIDNFRFTEDFTMGYRTSITAGLAGFPIPVGVKRFEYDISHRHRFRFSPDLLLFLYGSYESQVTRNTILEFSARNYWQTSTWHTLAFNMEADFGQDLEPHIQFTLGGENGLRGYKAREFSGDKRFLMNLESRLFTNWEILTVAIGTVAFIDAGHAWKRNESIDFTQLNYSAGVGLRLGMTKIPGSTVMRIDFGWPLGHGGGFGISLGVDQQFIAH